MLDAFDGLPGIALVPEPVEVLGHEPQLDDQVAGEVLRLGLAPLLSPEPARVASSSPMMMRASEPPMKLRRSAGSNRSSCGPPCHVVGGVLDGAGQVGCEVGKEPFGIAKIKAPGDVLRRIVEDHGHIDRQCAEHLV